MQKLSKLTQEEKVSALRNAILQKCQNQISGAQLQQIIDNINVERPYFIKATSKCQKFFNMVTEELIATSDRKTISYIKAFYGRYRQGSFYKVGHVSEFLNGLIDCRYGAAALKVTINQAAGEPPGVTYTLILFLPPII